MEIFPSKYAKTWDEKQICLNDCLERACFLIGKASHAVIVRFES